MVDLWEYFVGDDLSKMRKLPPIVPLVFYHGKAAWKVPTSIIDGFDADENLREFLRDFRYITCNIIPIPDDQLSSDPEVRAALLPLKYVHRHPDPEKLLEAVLSGLRGDSPLAAKVLYYILDKYPAVTIDMMKAVNERARPHREHDMVSLAAQEWLRQGRTEGRREGNIEGRGEGKRELFRVLLEARFGALPPEVKGQLSRLSADKLDLLTRRAATAELIEAVFVDDFRH
ncbi:hypothetical protein N825_17150 [Skermanella stibiiresistens SB22]|uniref:Transposase (putative) YhgA-like domain-containing protein n=1 Tax=Skermanella stibiiresistens SB22 TaxID=1385369 RepID=W9GV09_9PROT|nr:Rpn family recombination-promoting nuclease/putative transposase [Skermanella stibiiresistens]EWY37609.1 hypothetical protein N825_17150 [Skermanella stibiiresistens SB22]